MEEEMDEKTLESNVVSFIDYNSTPDGYTTGNIDPNNVLEGAKDELEIALVLGFDEFGEFYIASSTGSLERLNMLVTLAQDKILDIYKDGSY